MTPPAFHPGSTPELRGLLTIDVASELRKLSQAQLQGPWQLPAELVRRALRAGARRVDVSFAHHELVVIGEHDGLDPTHLGWTAALLDTHRDNDERHRALAALENAGELALLALAGVPQLRGLSIETVHDGRRHTLQLAKGGHGRLTLAVAAVAGAAGVGPQTTIRLRSPTIERAASTRWLADVARFAPVPVVIDGVAVADGLVGGLVQASLRMPLRGRVALMPERQAGHVSLLSFGLVAAHLSLPDSLSFEAVLEMGTPDGALDPARLREESLSLAPALAEQALELLLASAPQLATHHEVARAAVARLVLQAARRRQRIVEVEGLPVFRSLRAGATQLIDLAALRELASHDARGGRSLVALAPDDRPQDHALDAAAVVLIADDAERSLLTEVLRVRFVSPSRRESVHSLGATLRRVRHQLGRTLARWRDLVHLPVHRAPLPDADLTDDERALVVALRAELGHRPGPVRQAVLCSGAGPLRRAGSSGGPGAPGGKIGTLFLPRDNPIVAACVRAFRADPGWMRLIYPALVAGPGGGKRAGTS